MVVVVGVLLGVEDGLADALVVPLLSVLEVGLLSVVVSSVGIAAVETGVALSELGVLVPEEVEIAEGFAGTGID